MKFFFKWINANKIGRSQGNLYSGHDDIYFNIELTGLFVRRFVGGGIIIYVTILGLGFRLYIGRE